MKIGSNQSVVQKLKIRRSNHGYSFQGANAQSFPTLSEMIDNSNDENSKRLQTPYLGHRDTQSSSSMSSQMNFPSFEEDCEEGYAPLEPSPPSRKQGRQPPLPPSVKAPFRIPVREKPPKINDRPVPSPIKAPFELPVRQKPPKPVTTDLPELNDLPPPDVDDDIPDDSSDNNTSLDILGDNAPKDVEIIYHRSDVKKLLKGKPNGTFLIYQGDSLHPPHATLSQPYTIYANKLSTTSGKVILPPFLRLQILLNNAIKSCYQISMFVTQSL